MTMASGASYDFIIIGGGTTGLVLAARLSEDPSQRILVLEAGSDFSENPGVRTPSLWATLQGGEADWDFRSKSQTALDGREIPLNQGKALGGSTVTNALVFVPPVPSVIDSWEALGNRGWNWDTFYPYYAKSYTSPPADKSFEKALGIDGWSAKSNPAHGPVRLSFPGNPSHPVRKAWADTFKSIGHYMPQDPLLKASVGSFSNLATIDPANNERVDSATAYYNPIKSRKNLQVLTNATVQKIIFEGTEQSPRASGVVYESQTGATETVTCSKEVILAAGALQSPKILELSGVGNLELLEKHGIRPILNLPGVGENLQDHMLYTTSFAAVDDLETLDALQRQEPAAIEQATKEYATSRTGALANLGIYAYAYLPVIEHFSEQGRNTLSKLLTENRPSASDDPDQARAYAYYEVAEKALLDPSEPSAAYFCFTGKTYAQSAEDTKCITLTAIHSQPLSRGSVHIASKESSSAPVIDPNYLSNPIDLEIYAHHVLYIETIAASAPLSSLLKQPITHSAPSADITDLEAAKESIRKSAVSMWHYGGTCAMLPKEKNGVVDTELRVYGVANLRVVDASAIPLISTANLQSTVYAFAERAADIVKEAWKLE
ncbi:putative GMC oxidoreductase [Hypoxylon sp. NC1633]|nr:putative GMC oxidoreductase [Hypoxylon sp. NC1633]